MFSMSKIAKAILSIIMGSEVAFYATNKWTNRKKNPFIRAINYHDTSKKYAENFRRQLDWYSKHFDNCNYQQLRQLLDHGVWDAAKPGLIISFDDGFKSNYEIAAPLLEEFGFTGWFMIPYAFIDAKNDSHTEFALQNNIAYDSLVQSGDLAMSWDDIRDLERRGHIITCHSMNHKRLSDELTDAQLQEEIILSKAMLEAKLGHPITGFTWVGGEEESYSRRAFKFIQQAKYTEVFCTNSEPITGKQNQYFLERSNIEVDFNMSKLRLVLGGLYDKKYKRKRERIFKLLTV